MNVRRMRPGEEPSLWRLFHDTVHRVNRRDYSVEQLRAWAPDPPDHALWRSRMRARNPFVGVVGGAIVGYADLQGDGLIDHFFVGHRWQRRGVGRRLMATILTEAAAREIAGLYSNVSVTARPFFEAHGFVAEAEQRVEIDGVALTNFRMTRPLSGVQNNASGSRR